jgi:hypothetical protein
MRHCYRHAASLALVGWYLMVPPATPLMHPMSPISWWIHLGKYDTEKECDQALAEMYRKNEQAGFKMEGVNPEEVKRSYSLAQCIATDDPRLKGN